MGRSHPSARASWLLPYVLLIVLGCLDQAQAGYMSVGMTAAVQCGVATVSWSGDSGPYHLLLTPTAFVAHGYNVWIDSISDGTNSLSLDIKQPAGMQYMVTVWGASGINYAGTTDVLTVGASPTGNSSCFLSDSQILSLYDFSFNISNTDNGYPPQCTNLTLSWPTSLESNVTSDVARRDDSLSVPEVNEFYNTDDMTFNILDTSSSDKHAGNTTNPPTMFGFIPLGNSFSIPITYSSKSKYAKYLPSSSLSDTPTTHTSQGVTYLNWTVDLFKGTRFILVAGIGSSGRWASGGSTVMLTVGQGTTGCVGSEQSGGGAPSITASDTSTAAQTGGASGIGGHSGPNPAVRTAVACVVSIIGTLVIVGFIFLCRRSRRRRRLAANRGEPYNGGFVSLFKKTPTVVPTAKSVDGDNRDTPLDLIASRTGNGNDYHHPQQRTPLVVDTQNRSPISSPISGDPFGDSHSKQPFLSGPSRLGTYDSGTMSSPISPIRDRGDLRGTTMTRASSQDALLGPLARHVDSPADYEPEGSGTRTSMGTGSGFGTYSSVMGMGTGGGRGPLMLHNPESMERGDMFEDGIGEEGEDVPELKRDTIAQLGGSSAMATGPASVASAPPGPGPGRRRRGPPREQSQEMEYVVHRDAGRVNGSEAGAANNVLELPPRYEELHWTEEERRERETQTR